MYGKVLRAVESHMLQKMRQPLLEVVFLNGSDIVYDVEIGLSFGIFVMADIIGQPVIQPSRADIRIDGDSGFRIRKVGLGPVLPGRDRQYRQKQAEKQEIPFHDSSRFG